MQNYDHAIRKARELARSPEGKQLVEALRQMGGADLENALEAAAAGDLSGIQKELSVLLNNPQARKLLEQLE